MNTDLQQACFAALAVPRHEARARALDFSWHQAADLFAGYLVPAWADQRPVAAATVTKLSSGGPTLS